ncbi:MAG: hypothetical protein HY328_14010 [Chloroflexi bacterium]|nr:hypothetical protein [Chloroflexota bacterium]
MAEDKLRDPIPESFASLEEAGEFWDTHSTDDYEDMIQELDVDFDIQRRVYLVPIRDDLYRQAELQTTSGDLSIDELINYLLEQHLQHVSAF